MSVMLRIDGVEASSKVWKKLSYIADCVGPDI